MRCIFNSPFCVSHLTLQPSKGGIIISIMFNNDLSGGSHLSLACLFSSDSVYKLLYLVLCVGYVC